MDWIKEPNSTMDEPDVICIIRVCRSKEYCEGYGCFVLFN